MKYVVTILVCLLAAAFFLNYPVLIRMYPNVSEWAGFIKFYNARNWVYAAMFCTSFFVIMYYSKGFVKIVSEIAFIGSFASLFDLSIGIPHYLGSDIILMGFAVLFTIFQHWYYDRKVRRRG